MNDGELLLVRGGEVAALLAGREREVMEVVRQAYVTHAEGGSSLPHSLFLRFPDAPRNRIIALPAYLRGADEVAGVKWISSFPANTEQGIPRASAVILLNSAKTGRPYAILEGSLISAQRTAAAAALAATTLRRADDIESAGLIGCGVINDTTAQFLVAACPRLGRFLLHDRIPAAAERLRDDLRRRFPTLRVDVASEASEVLAATPLVALATTALEPYLDDLSACPRGALLLHTSLRDLTAGAILKCDNVVDDVDHVCRAATSIHLAEQQVGHRRFIRGTLADVLRGRIPARLDDRTVTAFSPFGLGILDLAVGNLVHALARREKRGLQIAGFFP